MSHLPAAASYWLGDWPNSRNDAFVGSCQNLSLFGTVTHCEEKSRKSRSAIGDAATSIPRYLDIRAPVVLKPGEGWKKLKPFILWLKILPLAMSHEIGVTHGPIKGAGLHIAVAQMFWKLAGTGLDAGLQLLSISTQELIPR
jgi:hypothetical protein